MSGKRDGLELEQGIIVGMHVIYNHFRELCLECHGPLYNSSYSALKRHYPSRWMIKLGPSHSSFGTYKAGSVLNGYDGAYGLTSRSKHIDNSTTRRLNGGATFRQRVHEVG